MEDEELKAEIKSTVEAQLRGLRHVIRTEIYKQMAPWWVRLIKAFTHWVLRRRYAYSAWRYARLTEKERDALDTKRINEVAHIIRTAGEKVPRRPREEVTGTAEVPECSFVHAIMGTTPITEV